MFRTVSEPYDPDNLLDRVSDPDTLELHYAQVKRREQDLLARLLPLDGGDVLSVGAGWHVGRHLFPAPAWRLTAVDLDLNAVRHATQTGQADDALVASAGELPFDPESFDVVLYRLVLHHVAYKRPLGPVIAEAARLLRPGGALVAVEPGLFHPVGAALAVANRIGVAERVHGTVDDLPLSPVALRAHARRAGPRAAGAHGHVRVAAPTARDPACGLSFGPIRLGPAPEGPGPPSPVLRTAAAATFGRLAGWWRMIGPAWQTAL